MINLFQNIKIILLHEIIFWLKGRQRRKIFAIVDSRRDFQRKMCLTGFLQLNKLLLFFFLL